MNRKVVIAAGVALCAFASVALAGDKTPGVSVSLGQGFFWGTMATVRGSANGNEYIGCRLSASTTAPASNFVQCIAKNANGDVVACAVSGPGNWNPIASLTPNSYLEIYFDVGTGACQEIYVDNYSSLPIIQP